jgi:hypothetical protein
MGAPSSCSRCGAAIQWVKTAKGKSLPLDLQPSPSVAAGNFVLRDGVAHYVSDEHRAQLVQTGDELVYIAHFATCAAARQRR